MQFLWVYIDDLIGKGLEWGIIFRLIFYASASFVPMALPLAVLLSSIMTYGGLGEHYELVAMKASGISLLRYMRPMFMAVIAITITAFLFSNYMLPLANLKFGSLLSDITNQKPALNIKEGVFYNGIDGFSIKIGSKAPDNKTIYDVIIYDHTSGRGNDNVVIADKGEMVMSEDKRYLILTMYNGKRYQEGKPTGELTGKHEETVTSFKTWEKWFDLSEFKFEEKDESMWSNHYKMMNLRQLQNSMDTINMEIQGRKQEFRNNLMPYYTFVRVDPDTLKVNVSDSFLTSSLDTLSVASEKEKELIVMNKALTQARNVKSFCGVAKRYIEYRDKSIRKHEIEWNRKFTLSIACLVMFLIGAPLGSIIRIGGFGWPLFLSIVLFVVFHVLNMTGENMAEEGKWTPVFGMWLPILALTPLGTLTTYTALNDSDWYRNSWLIRLIRLLIDRLKRKKP